MTTFRVSTYVQGMPLAQQLMARFELSSWLSGQGETELAKAVCNAATPEGLDPHLKSVDPLVKDAKPQDIFRSSRFFASGEMPTESSKQTAPDIDEMKEQLADIGESVRARIPAGEKLQGTKLLRRIDDAFAMDGSDEDYQALTQGLILEGQGYIVGVSGGELDTEISKRIITVPHSQDDPWIYAARLFIDAVRSKHVQHRGSVKTDHQWLADAFINGALDVWDLRITKNKVPAFMEKVSRYWARAQGMSHSASVEEYTGKLGAGFGQFILPRMRLALASNLSRSRIMEHLHLIDAHIFVFGRGWLTGHADRVRGNGEHGKVIAANLSSIAYCSLMKRDAGYMSVAASAVPGMLKAIADEVESLKSDGLHDATASIRANQGTIINRALTQGELMKYVSDALNAVPGTLKAIANEAERLEDEGLHDAAANIRANQGTIIYCALHQGGHMKYARNALGAVPGMLKAIADEANRLEGEGQQDAAASIRANLGSIISRALHGGGLMKYVRQALDAVPGMLKAIADEAKRLEDEGQEDAAASIRANQGSIMHRALSQGSLMKYVSDALGAVPGMLKAIADKAKRFDSDGLKDAAASIRANQGTIISRALARGRFMKYVSDALGAVPVMLKEISDAAVQLENDGQEDAAASIRANQGTIIYCALNQGGHMKYVSQALDAVPGMLTAIEDEANRLESEGQKTAAASIRANQGTIISRALDRGRLMKYVSDALGAVPVMLKEISDAAAQFENEGQEDAAASIRANQGIIMQRALTQGSLMKYVSNALGVVPGTLKAIADEAKRLEGEGLEDAAASIRANQGSIIARALIQGGLMSYVNDALGAVPGMLKAIADEAKRLEDEGQADAAASIRANMRSIISRAFDNGGLVESVHAELDAFRING